MAKWIDRLRDIIFDENEPDLGFIIAENAKNADGRSKSERYLLELAQAIELVLSEEITRIPNTQKTYIPAKFKVFISEEQNKTFPKEKRAVFEEGLSAIMMEKAQEIAGQLQLTAKSIKIELSGDANLSGDEIEVRAVSEASQTVEKIFAVAQQQSPPENRRRETINEGDTIDDDAFDFKPLYRLEVWRENKKIDDFPILKNKITVGREDDEKEANILLPTENLKISRFHAEINLNESNEIWVTAKHAKNPVVVAGQELRNGEQARLGADGEIRIYDFTLKIKFA